MTCNCETLTPGPTDDELGTQCIVCSGWVKEADKEPDKPAVNPLDPFGIYGYLQVPSPYISPGAAKVTDNTFTVKSGGTPDTFVGKEYEVHIPVSKQAIEQVKNRALRYLMDNAKDTKQDSAGFKCVHDPRGEYEYEAHGVDMCPECYKTLSRAEEYSDQKAEMRRQGVEREALRKALASHAAEEEDVWESW